MNTIKRLDVDGWLKSLSQKNLSTRANYKAMYSTWWDGIVTDPHLMMVPVDDHQVHRGDAVFEAIKVVNNKVYLLEPHLDRLERSARAISLSNPLNRSQMISMIEQTLQASGLSEAILRLFLSRGPGSFSPSPYDTLGAQVHLIVTQLQPVAQDKKSNGVKLAISKIPAKESWLAQIKSCNYLQNVLMKKEAIDRGVDFTLGLTPEGLITEGSTENLILLTHNRHLLKPKKANILLGTTMERAFELAKKIQQIEWIGEMDLTVDDLKSAQEIMMVGTTLDVLSVTEFEGIKVTTGKPGDISKKLCDQLIQDQK